MKLSEFFQSVGSPVAFYPRLVDFLGSIQATLFLCQFGYWEGKQLDEESGIYKTQDEIEKETGLGRSGQETARRQLRSKGYLFEKQKGIPKKLYYKFNWGLINKDWEIWAKERFSFSPPKSGRQESRKQGSSSGKNQRIIYTETTPETTSDKNILRTAETSSAHTQFISFWNQEVQRARGIKPMVAGKDGKNLQRVLKLGVGKQALEQGAVYFLNNYRFKEYTPSISTFLSAGVLNGILNRMKNGEGFWKELNGYLEKRGIAVSMIGFVENLEKMRATADSMASPGKNKTTQQHPF